MRIRMDKRRSGKIVERERKRLKMKGETGPFPTWFMFYTKRGGCALAVVGRATPAIALPK